MKSILIFVFGALFGAAGLFYMLQSEQLASAEVRVSLPAVLAPLPFKGDALPPVALEPVAGAMPLYIPVSNEAELLPDEVPAPEPVGPEPAQGAIADRPGEPLPAHPGALLIPVAGIASAQLQDTFHDMRGTTRSHEAIDIMAPLKTPVFAVDDGKVVKLFDSVPGGLTLYQYDQSATFAYYYAHLDSYAADLQEGQDIKRGDLIGYVGVTGNADPLAPHLHFAVFLLGPEKQWWKGSAINPYPLFKR